MPFVYIVECSDGSFYTGWSVDVEARVKVHNAGRGARYTRMHRPVKLVYSEEFETRSGALKREAEIKKLVKKDKESLIFQNEWRNPTDRV